MIEWNFSAHAIHKGRNGFEEAGDTESKLRQGALYERSQLLREMGEWKM